MNLKRAVGGAAVGLGAAAVGNRALRGDPGELDPPLGRQTETYRWRGFDVAYTEAGDPSNPDMVLLHGINAAGSSHEFRYVAEPRQVRREDVVLLGQGVDHVPELVARSRRVDAVQQDQVGVRGIAGLGVGDVEPAPAVGLQQIGRAHV